MKMETQRILMRSLAVAVVLAAVIWTTTESMKTELKNVCCTEVGQAEVTDPIISFRMQYESLPCVKAVIFETERVSSAVTGDNHGRTSKSLEDILSDTRSVAIETQRILMRSLAIVVVLAAVIWTRTAQQKIDSYCTKVSTSEVTDPIISFRTQKKVFNWSSKRPDFHTTNYYQLFMTKLVKDNLSKQLTAHQLFVTKLKMEIQRILMRSLAVAVVLAAVTWTTTAEYIKVNSCCTKVSKAEVTDPIISFKMKEESLPCVKAVIFETKRGYFCSDWRQPWVQKKVKQFFRAHRNKPLSSTPPPTSTISDQTREGQSTQATASPTTISDQTREGQSTQATASPTTISDQTREGQSTQATDRLSTISDQTREVTKPVKVKLPKQLTAQQLLVTKLVKDNLPKQLTGYQLLVTKLVKDNLPKQLTGYQLLVTKLVKDNLPKQLPAHQLLVTKLVKVKLPKQLTSYQLLVTKLVKVKLPKQLTVINY
ncbi:C-C motif chemokine 24 [Labeo rohita]|uniref:C-C motif chemokine 24 n=1 Tax=Labeo rohita TaxID=84645 RepID=A0ABQ8L4G4_LABRO|nr:C-C motif chemokine 24 [Labeo rohita]